jgi:hypothetical protein
MADPSRPLRSRVHLARRNAVRLYPSPKPCALATRWATTAASASGSSISAAASSARWTRSRSSGSSNQSSSWRVAWFSAIASASVGRINGRGGRRAAPGTCQAGASRHQCPWAGHLRATDDILRPRSFEIALHGPSTPKGCRRPVSTRGSGRQRPKCSPRPHCGLTCDFVCGPGGDRTHDQGIMSPLGRNHATRL